MCVKSTILTLKGPTADILAVGSEVNGFYDLGPPGGPLGASLPWSSREK